MVAYLNKSSATDKPSKHAPIEYYTSSLDPYLAMFAKRSVRPTLVETYEEVEKVDAEMESIEHYPTLWYERTYGNKNPLFLTKPEDERVHNLDGMVNMMQKLSNQVIDLEK